MPYAEFLQTTDEGEQEVIGRAVLAAGTMTLSVPDELANTLSAGVRVNRNGVWKTITPDKGEAFLKALPEVFNGAYLRARYVP